MSGEGKGLLKGNSGEMDLLFLRETLKMAVELLKNIKE